MGLLGIPPRPAAYGQTGHIHPDTYLKDLWKQEANCMAGLALLWPSSFTRLCWQFGFAFCTFKSPQHGKRLGTPFHCLCYAAYTHMAGGTSQYI